MLWDIGETDENFGECVFVFVLWKASKVSIYMFL